MSGMNDHPSSYLLRLAVGYGCAAVLLASIFLVSHAESMAMISTRLAAFSTFAVAFSILFGVVFYARRR